MAKGGSRAARAAVRYATKIGWAVFPLNGKQPYAGTRGHLDATTDPDRIAAWWEERPETNVGVRCDSERGPIVLDIDGPEGEKVVSGLDLPDTVEARSGKKGRHLFFGPAVDGKPVRRTTKVRDSLDILGDGGYVVVPPSIHPDTGRRYRWVHHPRKYRLAPFPRSLRVLLTEGGASDQKERTDVRVADIILEGERDDYLTSLAGTMRRRGMSAEEIFDALSAVNRRRCKPPLGEKQVWKIARSIGAKEPGPRGGQDLLLDARVVSEIEAQRVDWLWKQYIPLGEVTLLDGDPGVGKSTLWVELVRAVLVGGGLPHGDILPSPLTPRQLAWVKKAPGNYAIPRPLVVDPRVLVLSAEDDAGKMLRPKLGVAGIPPKYLKRIKIVDGVASPSTGKTVGFNLENPQHVEALEREVVAFGPSLLIMDPLSSHIGGKSDTHREAKVRSLIDPLARIAQKHGCTVLAVRHLTKSARDRSMYRGQGSIAFAAGARSILLAGLIPDTGENERTFGLAHIKSNYDQPGPSLAYRLVPVAVPSLGPDQSRSRIEWLGIEESLTASQMLAPERKESETPIDEARDFLQNYLKDGPQKQRDVVRDAGDCGITKRTLYRARKELGVRSDRPGGRTKEGHYKKDVLVYWYPPGQQAQST